MRGLAGLAVLVMACGSTHGVEPDGGDRDAGTATDAGGMDGGGASDAGGCVPVGCEIDCEHGLARGPDGCEICACAPAPDATCASADECVIARPTTGCCGCEQAYSRADVDADPCLVERREVPPAGCLPDPAACATIDCAACDTVVRAICEAGTCAGSSECAAGQIVFGLTCIPACASHRDCTLAADYGVCCGGCAGLPRAFVEADACFAERQSESTCAPAPGACDGLGCASPPLDCIASGAVAVCMSDGTCREGGLGGACPSGSHEDAGVCVPD